MRKNWKLPLSIKVASYRAKGRIDNIIAALLRTLPSVHKQLRIPAYRIKNIKDWVGKTRLKVIANKGMKLPSYSILYASLTSKPPAPKCPTDKYIPAYPTGLSQKKHYNYWDSRSGFDSRNGFYQKPSQQYDETFLVHILNGKILGPSGAVITHDGGLMEQSLWTWYDWIKKDRSQTAWRLPAPHQITVPCYTVVSNYAEGYPHWLMEVLPRLYGLQTLPASIKPTIIFNKELNQWQKDSIRLLGFEDYPSIFLNDQYLAIDQLYVPSYVGMPGTPHPEGCKWVREKMLTNFKISESPIRVYISRRLATKRKLLNEEEILPVLKTFGFVEVMAENLSLAEQVQLFGRAEAVVTPHGAGLGNLMFVPKGCKVLEILDRDYVNDHYYNLSGILELDYYYQLCNSINADTGKILTPGWDHITIDPEKLKISLKEMFP